MNSDLFSKDLGPKLFVFDAILSLKPGIGVFIFSFALVPAGNGDSLSRFPAAMAASGCRDV